MGDVRGEQTALRSEVAALRKAVEHLEPVGARTAVLVEQVAQLDKGVSRVESLIAEERRTRETIREKEREEARHVEEERKKEASTERRWRLLLLATVLLGVFAACVTIGVAVFG